MAVMVSHREREIEEIMKRYAQALTERDREDAGPVAAASGFIAWLEADGK